MKRPGWMTSLLLIGTAVLAVTLTGDVLAVSFGVLAVIVWGTLEYISRVSFRDTSLPRLRVLDNVGGVLIYLLIGILVASLLFNTIGYGSLRRAHNKALLRPRFNQVLALYYTAQSSWFSRPPSIFVYDLDLPRER